MDYILIVGDAITGQPWLADGTPQQFDRGVLPFKQRLPDKGAAFVLKDHYLARFPRAQVEIEASDGTGKWMFQNSRETLLELIASEAEVGDPGAGSALRKLFKKK